MLYGRGAATGRREATTATWSTDTLGAGTPPCSLTVSGDQGGHIAISDADQVILFSAPIQVAGPSPPPVVQPPSCPAVTPAPAGSLPGISIPALPSACYAVNHACFGPPDSLAVLLSMCGCTQLDILRVQGYQQLSSPLYYAKTQLVRGDVTVSAMPTCRALRAWR